MEGKNFRAMKMNSEAPKQKQRFNPECAIDAMASEGTQSLNTGEIFRKTYSIDQYNSLLERIFCLFRSSPTSQKNTCFVSFVLLLSPS